MEETSGWQSTSRRRGWSHKKVVLKSHYNPTIVLIQTALPPPHNQCQNRTARGPLSLCCQNTIGKQVGCEEREGERSRVTPKWYVSFCADPESRKILVREARRGGVVTQESNTSNSPSALPQLCPAFIRSTGSTGSTGCTEIRATGTLNGRGRCRRMIQFLSTETPALNPIILTYKIEVGEGGMEKAN